MFLLFFINSTKKSLIKDKTSWILGDHDCTTLIVSVLIQPFNCFSLQLHCNLQFKFPANIKFWPWELSAVSKYLISHCSCLSHFSGRVCVSVQIFPITTSPLRFSSPCVQSVSLILLLFFLFHFIFSVDQSLWFSAEHWNIVLRVLLTIECEKVEK